MNKELRINFQRKEDTALKDLEFLKKETGILSSSEIARYAIHRAALEIKRLKLGEEE